MPNDDHQHPHHAPASRGDTPRDRLEGGFEQVLFSSRWLMAPMYFGLVISLALITFIFWRELIETFPSMVGGSSDDAILVVLSLIDLTLAGNLLLIVLFSGYENFVSKLNVDDGGDRPDWMGKVDFAGLKMKLVGSIIAISAIHLLKEFMELGKDAGAEPTNDSHLYWLTVIHLTFVVSGLLLAVMDYLGARSGGKH